MKIALNKTNSEKNNNTPRRNHLQRGPIKSKPRSQFQFSPLDGAQYANISTAQKTSDQKKRCKIQQHYKENTTRLYSERKPKEDLEQSSQRHYNSQFNLNKQAYAQYGNALQTEQSDAPCNFIKANHLYLMKQRSLK